MDERVLEDEEAEDQDNNEQQPPLSTCETTRRAHARQHRMRPSSVLATLAMARSKFAAQVVELEAQHEELKARHEVLELTVHVLHQIILATQPLRAAAMAAAEPLAEAPPLGQHGAGVGGAHPLGGAASGSRAPWAQEAMLDSCLSQICSMGSGPACLRADHGEGGSAAPAAWEGAGAGPCRGFGVAGCGCGPPPSWARHVCGGDSPEEALRRYLRCTPREFAEQVASFARDCAMDVFSIREQLPCAEEAARRLSERVDRHIASHTGLLAVNPYTHARACVMRLDTFKPLQSPAPREHWVGCVRSLRLTPKQELLISALLAQHRTRVAPVFKRREELMRRQREFAVFDDLAAPGDEAEMLREVEACQLKFAWLASAHSVVLFGSILTPEQTASAQMSAYPHSPMLIGIEEGMRGAGLLK